MRSEIQMLNTIIGIACADARINAAVIVGSKADRNIEKDPYQDYDIEFYVDDLYPFWDNLEWFESCFGRILILQRPDIMDNPDASCESSERFTYLAIFDDGVRVDLTVKKTRFSNNGEPCIVLVDKKHQISDLVVDQGYWNVKPPSQCEFSACCNEFWWCLNNVAKGIQREEMPYAMEMLNSIVRDQLNKMTSWYIGTITDFSVSTGKMGKYFKKYLPDDTYRRYLKTYCPAESTRLWSSVIEMCKLFSDLAHIVSGDVGLSYCSGEEDGMREYLAGVRDGIYIK